MVIPAYNSERYIGRALESVLGQSYGVSEIIVVDDGSSDGTAEAVRGFGEAVRLIEQENGGASAARNAGIKSASGEWVAFLDADDEWLVDKLAKQVEILEGNPELVWVSGNYYQELTSEGRRGIYTPVEKCREILGGKDYFESYFEAFGIGVWGHTDMMVIRRDVLFSAGLFRVGQLKANDIDMWLRVAYLYPRIGFCCDGGSVYYLEVADSIVKKYRDVDIYADFLRRHVELAREAGRLEEFEGCAGYMVRRWIRGMLFYEDNGRIGELYGEFGYLMGGWGRFVYWFLTLRPGFTRVLFHFISRVVRFFGLRRRPVRRPGRQG